MEKPDLLALDEWSDTDVDRLLSSAARLKQSGGSSGLERKVLALVVADRDPTTEASVSTAMYLHGGHATFYDVNRERGAPEELARTLARWADGLAVRVLSREPEWAVARTDPVLQCFAEESNKPVLNLGSIRRNPCQSLADAMTLRERLGEPEGKRFVLTWSWDPDPLPTAVPASAALAAARLGMEIVIARPEGFELDPEDTALVRKLAQHAGGEFVHISDDPDDALVGADVVYVASWGSVKLYGRREEEAAARNQFRDWGLTRFRHRGTRAGKGVVMHALPVRRNVAIESELLDGPDSAVVDQSENLLHAHRAVLLDLMGGRTDND